MCEKQMEGVDLTVHDAASCATGKKFRETCQITCKAGFSGTAVTNVCAAINLLRSGLEEKEKILLELEWKKLLQI